MGVIPTHQALAEAKTRGLDLVLIATETQPPVAKILDFNKFLYQENKKKSAAKAKSKKSELKEVRIGPSVGMGDVQRYLTRAKEWLEDGNRVKVTVSMRGRENLFPDKAFEKVALFTEGLEEVAKPEDVAKRLGNMISIVFIAK